MLWGTANEVNSPKAGIDLFDKIAITDKKLVTYQVRYRAQVRMFTVVPLLIVLYTDSDRTHWTTSGTRLETFQSGSLTTVSPGLSRTSRVDDRSLPILVVLVVLTPVLVSLVPVRFCFDVYCVYVHVLLLTAYLLHT